MGKNAIYTLYLLMKMSVVEMFFDQIAWIKRFL
jgi:hypothetical protein